jgi:hypothetical protein
MHGCYRNAFMPDGKLIVVSGKWLNTVTAVETTKRGKEDSEPLRAL